MTPILLELVTVSAIEVPLLEDVVQGPVEVPRSKAA